MKFVNLTAPAALAFVGILVASLAIAPIAIASSSGSDYSIEIVRAHATYKTANVVAPSSAFLTNPGISPDVMLGRESRLQ